ncbi:hypothetical protein LOK49_LG10G00769 [Camellia lanceoleosa]|uniref:Uncharacterized protein n=1 Tax=Camellia lanceoleosa TaxID=1840588 RepID=A0ACC0G6N2_9ERIC|nr:hypothetical protein LOK49_LG10G00769 [Camellia lanceoleosa]
MDFWNAKNEARASWVWASILKGRKVLNRGVRWQVINGKSIKFWKDKWVASSKKFRVKSLKPSGCSLSIVSEPINSASKCWNKTVLHSLVSHEEVEEICAIPIAIEDQNDRLIWHHDPKGTSSIKSGYIVEIEYQQHEVGD